MKMKFRVKGWGLTEPTHPQTPFESAPDQLSHTSRFVTKIYIYMGCAKRKGFFKHAQNAQIQIHPGHAQSFISAFALHWYILQNLMILLADTDGPYQTARKHRLIWAFAVYIFLETHFRMLQPIHSMPKAMQILCITNLRKGCCVQSIHYGSVPF